MLQQESPDDYVVATGEMHTVRDFCAAAFDRAGLDWERYVVVDEHCSARVTSTSCSAMRSRPGANSAGPRR